jgi:DNA repair exonuclease SbcCD ATPase subunit
MRSLVLACAIALGVGVTGRAATAQLIIPDRDNDADDSRRAERQREARAARAEIERAEASVKAAAARVRTSWKANPEMIAAEKELDEARAARDKERKRVVQALEGDAAYKRIKSEHAAAAGDVRTEQDRGNAAAPAATRPNATQPAVAADVTPGQIEAATEKLEAKSELRDFEDRAVAADAPAAAAAARFDAAQEKLKTLQLQLDAALVNDAEYKAAQDQLAAARGRMNTPSAR